MSNPAPAGFAGTPAPRERLAVLGSPIDVVTPLQAIASISAWAQARESRCVCICNVHSVVTAGHDARFGSAIAGADLATPDGAPVAWMLRRLGAAGQGRVSGPDLMWDYCEHAQAEGQSIFLLGSTPDTLRRLAERLRARWPALHIAGTCSPPFRSLSADEDEVIVKQINRSGAGTVWVSLGCPKQELWMSEHRGRVRAVMIGVGAAFDFHGGTVTRAPRWMQSRGLEWLHRLASDPGRLWRRYLFTNTAFVFGAARQLAVQRR